MSQVVRLADTRPTKTVNLTDYPGSKVTVYTTAVVGDQREIRNITDSFDRGLKFICRAIKEWNFWDEKDNILPIDEKNLSLLTATAFTELMCAVTGKTEEELIAIGENAKKKEIQSSKKSSEDS